MTKNTSWWDKVTAFIKGGDERKFQRFTTKVDQYINKQISMRKERISDLKEKIADKKEAFDNYLLDINFETNLATLEAVDNYAPRFVEGAKVRIDEIEELENEIKALENEISQMESLSKKVFTESSENK